MPKPTDRAYAVLAAAARDINDNLMVILNGLAQALEDDPASVSVIEAQAAAGRCASIAEALLDYGAKANVRPSSASLQALIDG